MKPFPLRLHAWIVVVLSFPAFWAGPSLAEEPPDSKDVLVLWQKGSQAGEIVAVDGEIEELKPQTGQGTVDGRTFKFIGDAPAGLGLRIGKARLTPGPGPTRITVRENEHSFTFFLRDVHRDFPIYIPEYGVIVTEAGDTRGYAAIEKEIRGKNRKTKLERYEAEPEQSWSGAASRTRHLELPIWLGLTRDVRLFEIETQKNERMNEDLKYESILAHYYRADSPPSQKFVFMVGKGSTAAETIERRLDDGDLPILRATRRQDDIEYKILAFATLEHSPLKMENIRGTDHLVSHYLVGGNSLAALTKEQQQAAEKLLPEETNPELEQPVLYFRATARNRGDAPHYAYFLAPNPNTSLDPNRGAFVDGNGRVMEVATLNGRPLANEEVAILLAPGEEAILECRIPHHSLTPERAAVVAAQDFDKRLAECRAFWRTKLAAGTQIEVPDPKVNELIKAGTLYLDLLCFGREPDGPVAAGTGYAPIGTESAPVIQFLDSMGYHKLAGRALVSFLEKQHEDGFMRNYGDYQGEVGPVLWSIGEHWRYTHDESWARSVAPRVIKSADYLINRRHREGDGKPRGQGHGMFNGNMGDPKDPYPSFTLNAYSYLGLARAAEMLASIDPTNAARLKTEAEAYRADLRENYFTALADSPVVPLGNGTWAPAPPPWVGEPGALILYARDGQHHYFTHGSLTVRDGLVGPIYLPFTEVLAPTEQSARWLSEIQAEIFSVDNSVPTQPYYSQNPWLQLEQGRVRSFLRSYYDTITSTVDRDIYAPLEHPFGGAVYKTHELAWFLMQTRWMLWLEEGKKLRLLAGVPRAWLQDGKNIRVKNAASYFGPLSLEVASKLSEGRIVAEVECDGPRAPEEITVRLPHPEGKIPRSVEGGTFDPKTETVRVAPFSGRAHIALKY